MSSKLSFTMGTNVHSSKKAGILPVAKNHLQRVVTWYINLLDAFIKQSELKSNTASLFFAFILFSASLTDWWLTLYISSCNHDELFLVYFTTLYQNLISLQKIKIYNIFLYKKLRFTIYFSQKNQDFYLKVIFRGVCPVQSRNKYWLGRLGTAIDEKWIFGSAYP